MNKNKAMTANNFGWMDCKPHAKGEKGLDAPALKLFMSQLPDWKLVGKEIVRTFGFKDFYETMGFVNAVAFIANREDHHPDLEVGYKTCKVRYSSHDLGGLSENDFICATKIDVLINGVSVEWGRT